MWECEDIVLLFLYKHMREDINTQFFEPQMFKGAPALLEEGLQRRTRWRQQDMVAQEATPWTCWTRHRIMQCARKEGSGACKRIQKALIWVERSSVSTSRPISHLQNEAKSGAPLEKFEIHWFKWISKLAKQPCSQCREVGAMGLTLGGQGRKGGGTFRGGGWNERFVSLTLGEAARCQRGCFAPSSHSQSHEEWERAKRVGGEAPPSPVLWVGQQCPEGRWTFHHPDLPGTRSCWEWNHSAPSSPKEKTRAPPAKCGECLSLPLGIFVSPKEWEEHTALGKTQWWGQKGVITEEMQTREEERSLVSLPVSSHLLQKSCWP